MSSIKFNRGGTRALSPFLMALLLMPYLSCQNAAPATESSTLTAASSKPLTYPIGSKVTLQAKYGRAVGLSDSSESWMDEHIIARLPNGTPAEIILPVKLQLVNGQELVRYKVAVTYQGKEHVGWVGTLDILNAK